MSSPIAIPTRSRITASDGNSSFSDRSSTSSPSSSWTPSGVYIPVHKRRTANSSVSSLPSVASSSSSSSSTSRIYSRDALLSLARSPLTSFEAPQLTPTLLSACPEIVDGHASGIARALAMGRTPVWHGNNSRGHGHGRGRQSRRAKRDGDNKAKRGSSMSSESSDQ